MKVRAVVAGLALVSAVAACGRSGDPMAIDDPAQQVTSPDEVELTIGDVVRVDGLLRIGFTAVPADSRCPATVWCPWQGDAAVEIQYGLGTGSSSADTLHTALDPQSVTASGYQITLLVVGPYPYSTDPIPQDQYTIRLRVARAGQ